MGKSGSGSAEGTRSPELEVQEAQGSPVVEVQEILELSRGIRSGQEIRLSCNNPLSKVYCPHSTQAQSSKYKSRKSKEEEELEQKRFGRSGVRLEVNF